MRREVPLYVSEFLGTGLMLFWGVTAVAFMWGDGSPVPAVDPPILRRLLTGILFAGGATAVVYSPLGQRSGGHINPAVTLAFWRLGKLPGRTVPGYVVAQVLGALAGTAAAMLTWGDLARSVRLAATTPGDGWGWPPALVAEVIITFLLVFTIFVCVNKPRLAARTGIIAGSLVAILVMVEAPISGTSLNPARSAAPALLAPVFTDQWIYFVGPVIGALLAVFTYRQRWGRPTVCAKLYHTAAYPCPFETCGYRRVTAGETVIREGEVGDEAYLVEHGTLEVRRGAMRLATLGPGDWVGEMSLLLNEPRTATVVALTEVQLRRVTRDTFGHLLAEDADRTQALLRQLARRVRDTSERLAEEEASRASATSSVASGAGPPV